MTNPRQYTATPLWGGRRHTRRYTRCKAVVNELAKKMVSTRPSRPVACRTSSDDANASLASVSASPRTPSRAVTAVMSDERMLSGTKAATTITSGKNETKAFPASATLRSTNSISSMRSHTRQRSRRCSRVRRPEIRSRPSVLRVPGVAMAWIV